MFRGQSIPILTPFLLAALVLATAADGVMFSDQSWRPGGLFSEAASEHWRLLTYSLFLGGPLQAILTWITVALVAFGLEQQRGGSLLLGARWLVATLALGACQLIAPPLVITGATLVCVSLLIECMLSSYQKGQAAPWKTWGLLLAGNLASAFLQGWIIPTIFLSLFLGAAFTVASEKLAFGHTDAST